MSILQNTCKEILGDLTKICQLVPPWTKYSRNIGSAMNMQDPNMEVEQEFNLEFSKYMINLGKHLNTLFEYMFLPYFGSTDTPEVAAMYQSQRKQDAGFHTLSQGQETDYMFISILKECLFLAELCYIQNTKASSSWMRLRHTKPKKNNNLLEQQVTTRYSLAGQLLLEMARIRTLIFCFSLKRIKERQVNKRTPKAEDFLVLQENRLLCPVISKDPTEFVEDYSIWMYISKQIYPIQSPFLTQMPTPEIKSESRPKCIAMYSMHNVHEAFRYLMYDWNLVNYHAELDQFSNCLLDRASFILTFKNMGLEWFGAPQKYKTQLFMNIPEMLIGGFNASNSNDNAKKELIKFQDGYIYRMSLWFYYVLEKLHRFHHRRCIVKYIPEKLPYLIENQSMHTKITEFFIKWCHTWASGQMGEIAQEGIKRRYLDLLVPPGDKEWLSFFLPTEPTTTTNIITKLHDKNAESIFGKTNTKILSFLERGVAENSKLMNIQRLHDEIVLKAIEPLFTDTSEDISSAFSFTNAYMVTEEKEDLTFTKQFQFEQRNEPFLAFLFSRILIHFSTQDENVPKEFELVNGEMSQESPFQVVQKSFMYSISSRPLVKMYKPTILMAIITDKSIYHVMAHFLIILLQFYKDSPRTKYLWTKLNVAINYS